MTQIKLVRKLQQIKNSTYFLVIPSDLVRLKGWSKGTEIVIEEDKGNIVLKKKE